jgi:thiol-disulfide isomerase/thioredoxin
MNTWKTRALDHSQDQSHNQSPEQPSEQSLNDGSDTSRVNEVNEAYKISGISPRASQKMQKMQKISRSIPFCLLCVASAVLAASCLHSCAPGGGSSSQKTTSNPSDSLASNSLPNSTTHSTKGSTTQAQKPHKTYPVVMGEISWKDWQRAAQWETYAPPANYTPSPAFTSRIEEDVRATDLDLRFILFAGSWCEDSQTELPKFFALADAASIPANKITIIGVDENKFEPSGMAAKYGIYKIPTLIALKNGKETGRIIEKPRTSWELDVIVIIER